jgi:histidinol-phosphate aminotransferase
VRPEFRLNLDREETTCPPAVSLEEADRRRRKEFPIQQSNRYPSKMIERALIEAIAADLGLAPANVLVGNGIMSILTYVYDVFSRPGDNVTVPTPGFWPAYTYAMQRGRGIFMPVYVADRSDPLRPRFFFPIDGVREALSRGAAICYLCCPNNPTGTLIPVEYLAALVTEFPRTLFVWDEAYGPFAAHRLNPALLDLPHAVELVRQGCTNLAVTRTFSKVHAIANHRIGYLISHGNNIDTLRAHMGPYDMSEISLAMAYYNYRERDFVRGVVRIVTEHMQEYEAFLTQRGIASYGGYRNSLLVEGLELGQRYEAEGIAVRSMVYQENIPNPISSTFRITMPADTPNFEFLMQVTASIA